jgi:hypothetical protein
MTLFDIPIVLAFCEFLFSFRVREFFQLFV